MSRAVLIISPQDNLLPDFHSKIKASDVDCSLETNITVSKQYENAVCRLYIDFHGELSNVEDWFDEEEDAVKYKAKLNSLGHKTLFVYYISFGNLSLAKEILLMIGNSNQLIIDGDSDIVLVGSEFVKKIQDNPDWDWA